MRVEMLTVGMFQSNCYIVSCEETDEAIIVDACDEAGTILAAVEKHGLVVKSIVTTHAHIDHVSALAEVVSALSVPVLMHKNDIPVYKSLAQHAMMFGLPAPAGVDIDRFVKEGDEVAFGRLTGKVVETPGHSPGGISLVFGDATPPRVFVGDVLFRGSIGRTDLPGANHQQMMMTLRNIIMQLPDDMIVYAGHGPETTIGVEKVTNPFLIELAG